MNSSFRKYYSILLVGMVFLASNTLLAQFSIPERPEDTEQRFVYDYVNLLSEANNRTLNYKLKRYADSTSTQIVVAIIGTTNGEDISFLGAKWGQKWGIGQADEDNGILVLLAKDDRKVDINTGYGIEYRITDRMAEQVINTYMIPSFKEGRYYNGLDLGTSMMMLMLEGEFKAEKKESDFDYTTVIIIALFLLFWIIMITASRKGRGGGNGGRGGGTGSLWDVIVLSNAGRTSGGWGGSSGGSWGGGSSGGGFGGGFGGGGFGGGGASGSW